MNNLSKTVLAIMLGVITLPAFAAVTVLDKTFLQTKIEDELNYKYQQINPNGSVTVKNIPVVSVNNLTSTVIVDASCDFNSTLPVKNAKVSLLSNGEIIKTFFVQVEVTSPKYVLTAKYDIAKGEPLSEENTYFELKSTGYNSANAINQNEAYLGEVAQFPIKAGSVINKRLLAKKITIMRNSPVYATFQTGGIKLVIETVALENGSMGQYIKVKSKEYNKIYEGKVISENSVLIQIWGIYLWSLGRKV